MLVRDPEGKRAPQAFFSTDTTLDPAEILALFVRRWQVEVTFAETRAHLGVETQPWKPNLAPTTVSFPARSMRKTPLPADRRFILRPQGGKIGQKTGGAIPCVSV